MLKFENVRNIRDMSAHGPIRPGVLYRSGNLSEATDGELNALFHMGVCSVIDLRVDREANAGPDRLPNGASLYRVPLLLNGSTPGHTAVERIKRGTAGPPKADMTEGYRMMAKQYAPAFGKALNVIADSRGASLFHCQHGKDRVGVLAALILALAHTDYDAIMEDYLATNDELAPYFMPDFTMKTAGMDETQKAVMRSVFTAEPEYLDAFFEGMRHIAPTPEDYVLNSAGIQREKLDKLFFKLGCGGYGNPSADVSA